MDIFEHMMDEKRTPNEAAFAALEDVQADCNGFDCADCPLLRTSRERWGYDGEQPADVEVYECTATCPDDCKRLERDLADFDRDLDFPTRLIAQAEHLAQKLPRTEDDPNHTASMIYDLTHTLRMWRDYALALAERLDRNGR